MLPHYTRYRHSNTSATLYPVQTRSDGDPKLMPGSRDSKNVEHKRFVDRLNMGYRKMGHMANNCKYFGLRKWTVRASYAVI